MDPSKKPFELGSLRRLLIEHTSHSHTSNQFQEDVLSIIEESTKPGEAVLELGCYRGGLSAMVANNLWGKGIKLFIVDIDPAMTGHTRNLLEQLGLDGNVDIYTGTIEEFAQDSSFPANIAVAIIDADHRYEAVLKDIAVIKRLSEKPQKLIFHDYGLRYPESSEFSNVNVQRAISEEFHQHQIRLIGSVPGEGGLPTIDAPSADNSCYFVDREGALVSMQD